MLFLVAPASAQLTIAPSGGATIFIVDGPDGKEAKQVGDLFSQVEYQFPIDVDGRSYLGVLALYDGDDFGGFGMRYYRRVSDTVFPMFGANMTMMGEDREHIAELTLALGVEVGLELWIPGTSDDGFPLTIGAGYRWDVVGTDVSIIPLQLSVPLTLFGDR